MRITFSHFDDLNNPYYGGGAMAVHEVARRLVDRHHAVTVPTNCYPGYADEVIDGFHSRRVGFHIFDARIGQLAFHFSLPWYVMTAKFDVWVESFTPPFSTALLPLFTSKPVATLTFIFTAVLVRLAILTRKDFTVGTWPIAISTKRSIL